MCENGGSIYSNSELMEDLKAIKEDNAKARSQKRAAARRKGLGNFFGSLFKGSDLDSDIGTIGGAVDEAFDALDDISELFGG